MDDPNFARIEVDEHAVIQAMIDMGGGFVSRLGQAWMAADPENRRRLRAAFNEYWNAYTTTARFARYNEMRREVQT